MSILDDVLSGRYDGHGARGQVAAVPIGAGGSPAVAPQRPRKTSRARRRSRSWMDVTSYPPNLRLKRCRCPIVTCVSGRAGACLHDLSTGEMACTRGCRSAIAEFSVSRGLWYVRCACRCSGCTSRRLPMPIGWSPPGWSLPDPGVDLIITL